MMRIFTLRRTLCAPSTGACTPVRKRAVATRAGALSAHAGKVHYSISTCTIATRARISLDAGWPLAQQRPCVQGTDLNGRWTAGVSCQAALEMLLDDELDIEGYTMHHAQPSGMFIGTVQVLLLLTSEAQALQPKRLYQTATLPDMQMYPNCGATAVDSCAVGISCCALLCNKALHRRPWARLLLRASGCCKHTGISSTYFNHECYTSSLNKASDSFGSTPDTGPIIGYFIPEYPARVSRCIT